MGEGKGEGDTGMKIKTQREKKLTVMEIIIQLIVLVSFLIYVKLRKPADTKNSGEKKYKGKVHISTGGKVTPPDQRN